MGEARTEAKTLPVTNFIKLPENAAPYLEGHKCGNCGAIFMGPRNVCSKCTTRDKMTAVKLPSRGSLYAFSVVHRSFPGVKTPFVSAIVDIEGGGTVKGNLIDIEPDPKKIEMGMPVEIVFADVGKTDDKGNRYISYFFKPAKRS